MTRDLILHLHKLIGIIIFITGLMQIALKKGGLRHRIIGQVYLYCWFLLLISGAYLGGLFMTIIGVFGFYFALTESKIGHLKNNTLTNLSNRTYQLMFKTV